MGVQPLPVPAGVSAWVKSEETPRDPYWGTGYDLILDTNALASWVTYHEAQGHRLENYQGEELQGFWCMDCDKLAACHTKNFHQRGKLYMTWQRLRTPANPKPKPRAPLLYRINQTIDDLNVWADGFWAKRLGPPEEEPGGGSDNAAYLKVVNTLSVLTKPKPEEGGYSSSALIELGRFTNALLEDALTKPEPAPEHPSLSRPDPHSMCLCVKCSKPLMRKEEKCYRCGFVLPFCPMCGSSEPVDKNRRTCTVCGHWFTHLPSDSPSWKSQLEVLEESYRRMQQYQPGAITS